MPIGLIAGFGCRRGCTADELHDLLSHSLAVHGRQPAELVGLASGEHKRGEHGLQALAERLGLPLSWPSAEALTRFAGQAEANPLTQRVTGSPALAEPSALAAAAQLGVARLLGPRLRSANATCALVAIEGEHST